MKTPRFSRPGRGWAWVWPLLPFIFACIFAAAPAHSAGGTGYDPLAAAAAEKLIGNVEAGVPPQC